MSEEPRTEPPEELPSPLRSAHTASVPQILEQLGVSLVVSTYQADKLVFLRSDNGVLNSHFRNFPKPMGIAAGAARLSVGGGPVIHEFQNVPQVGRERTPPADACYLPRSSHVTGEIDVHELAHGAKGELWLVNTRFSCLCTLAPTSSFVPLWVPPFISKLAPDDHCHLNGLGMDAGRPRFVTALGATDTPEGWRANRANGGVLIDVASREVIARGLSMPHSPRWHAGRLWLLESGTGSFATIDLATGRIETICRLPGFTRGLAFHGDYAFIGLSQVRETAVFSGIPITEQPGERRSGVWIIDLRTGKPTGFVQFEDAIQEIFAVEVLPGIRFPELITDDPDVIASAFVLPDLRQPLANQQQTSQTGHVSRS